MYIELYYHTSLILFISGWVGFVIIKTLIEIIPL